MDPKNGPRNREDNTASTFQTRPDVTPRREGGDDAIAERNPSDSRMDEKVIVNEQESQRIVNNDDGDSANNDII